MSQIFNSIPRPKIPRNNFNLSHELLTSGRIGKLIPIQAQLAVPGDRFQQHINYLMRFAPLAGPAMARFNVHFHSFFVPLRLCTAQNSRQSGWEDFMEAVNEDALDIPKLPNVNCYYEGEIDKVPDEWVSVNHKLTFNEIAVGSLWDYLKLPVGNPDGLVDNKLSVHRDKFPANGISIMKLIAYQLIYDQWYRRDQIEKPLILPMDVGEINIISLPESEFTLDAKELENQGLEDNVDTRARAIHNLFKLRSSNYERDYFTSALPSPQLGEDTALGNISELSNGVLTAHVDYIGGSGVSRSLDANVRGGAIQMPIYTSVISPDSVDGRLARYDATNDAYIPLPVYLTSSSPNVDNTRLTNVQISGLQVNPITINEFRFAMQYQGLKEKLNRAGGTRFKEIMYALYNVNTADARLQRVQYLGGCKNPVQIGTVVQTSQTTNDSPLGSLAGKATSAGGTLLFKNKHIIDEHGFIFTIMRVTPRTSYFGGIPRDMLLHDPIDFYIPDFDRLGENVIYNAELTSSIFEGDQNESTLEPDGVFGYTPQYSYLKSSTSSVTGEFRNTLRYLHVSRSFDGLPTLSPDFIHADSEDFDRIFNFENIEGTSNEHFYSEIIITQKAKRPMSKYSTPITLY